MKLLYVLPALVVSASLIACAVHSGNDGEASSTNAISVPIDTQRACAAAGTYIADGQNDFDTPADSTVPEAVRNAANGQGISHFRAPSVGDVFAIGSYGQSVALYDVNGRSLAVGNASFGNGQVYWFAASGNSLDCSGTAYNVPTIDMSSSSSGWSSSGTTSGTIDVDASAGDDDDNNASSSGGGVIVTVPEAGSPR